MVYKYNTTYQHALAVCALLTGILLKGLTVKICV